MIASKSEQRMQTSEDWRVSVSVLWSESLVLHSVLLCTKNALGLPLLFKITNKITDIHAALVIYQSLITNGKDYDILAFLGGLDGKDHWQPSIGVQVGTGQLLCIADSKWWLWYVVHFHLSLHKVFPQTGSDNRQLQSTCIYMRRLLC